MLNISINWEWAKRVGKKVFLKELEHFGAKEVLSKMYDDKFNSKKKP